MKLLNKGKWLLFCSLFFLVGCQDVITENSKIATSEPSESLETKVEEPLYEKVFDGEHQDIIINNNQPKFTQQDLSLENQEWQTFSDLDHLNRVGVANAMLGEAIFPTKKREQLTIKPTGWQQKKIGKGQWLYNRSHLIGFQLTGENNNIKNLMTGTREFNSPYMLLYENDIKYYMDQTGNHVRYRVTPIFKDNELVARGVQLEAQSVEDDGLKFNVYIFNVQNGYTIDYLTGRATKSE